MLVTMKAPFVHQPIAPSNRHPKALGQTGFSMVEFLVGSAIGMVLLTTGTLLWAEHTRMHHESVRQARLDHDLRTSARLIISHLRRAGYWASPQAHRPNPYGPFQIQGETTLFYASRDTTENHRVDANEAFGIRLKAGVLEFALGAHNWQALTDPQVLRIRSFELRPAASNASCARAKGPLLLQLSIVAEATRGSPLSQRHEALVALRNHLAPTNCLQPESL